MHLYALVGIDPSSGGTVATLEAQAAFHAGTVHDYDDTQSGGGCTADHYDAVDKPAPTDVDAGFQLRMSGFAGGTLTSQTAAGEPIVCSRVMGYYVCSYPAGQLVSGGDFSPNVDPLGPGPVTFALNGGVDFGAGAVTASPAGTVATREDLDTIAYGTSADTTLHLACSASSCTSGRIAVELTARASAFAGQGWPYPSAGVVRCVFPGASSVTIPHAAIAAMFAGDASLDSVASSVVFLPASLSTATDAVGHRLVADVGRGVFGVAPR
jgi:hypothetical protein